MFPQLQQQPGQLRLLACLEDGKLLLQKTAMGRASLLAQLPPGRGQKNGPGPPVGRVLASLHQTLGDQVVDDPGHFAVVNQHLVAQLTHALAIPFGEQAQRVVLGQGQIKGLKHLLPPKLQVNERLPQKCVKILFNHATILLPNENISNENKIGGIHILQR